MSTERISPVSRRQVLTTAVATAAAAATVPRWTQPARAATMPSIPEVTVNHAVVAYTNHAWTVLAAKKGFLKDVGISMAGGAPKSAARSADGAGAGERRTRHHHDVFRLDRASARQGNEHQADPRLQLLAGQHDPDLAQSWLQDRRRVPCPGPAVGPGRGGGDAADEGPEVHRHRQPEHLSVERLCARPRRTEHEGHGDGTDRGSQGGTTRNQRPGAVRGPGRGGADLPAAVPGRLEGGDEHAPDGQAHDRRPWLGVEQLAEL